MNAKQRPWRSWMLTAGLSAVALGGPACAPKTQPTMAPAPAAQSDDAKAFDAGALQTAIASLEASARALPGKTPDEHRSAMYAYFGQLAEVLTTLEGPEPSGMFRQQIRSLQRSRERLSPDSPVVSVEPAINTGLRAAGAFRQMGKDDDFASEPLNALLAKLDASIVELDNVRNVGLPYIASDAANLTVQIAYTMAATLTGPMQAGTTEPAMAPAMPAEPAEPAPAPAAEAPVATEAAPAPADAAPAEAAPVDASPTPAQDFNK